MAFRKKDFCLRLLKAYFFMVLNIPLDELGWFLMPYSIFLRGSLYLGSNHRIQMGKIDHADCIYNISWKKIIQSRKVYAICFCCAAIFVIALEAIHTGFYFHNDFLIQFQSYVNSFFSLWFLLIFCSIYCSFSLSAYSKRGLSEAEMIM